jgi:hypothetical protein
MMQRYRTLLVFVLGMLLSGFQFRQQAGIQIVEAKATLNFPEEIEFTIELESDVLIEVVELEYGLDVSSCVTDVNRVIPDDFQPGYDVNTYWVWNMRRTGSLPPGARLWWRWHVVDAGGIELRTEKQWLTWIDRAHTWRTVKSGNVYLHWYAGDETFANRLLDAAVEAQDLLEHDIGTHLDRDVNLYIYKDFDDLRDAILFEPSWAGGLAYSGFAIVIIGISPDNLDWGIDTISHEFAHVMVGSAVDHCYSSIPTWLNEGLAMYAEGGLDDYSEYLLSEAIDDDQLLSVRSLSDSFAEHTEIAQLSYAQSYSLVEFLIDEYGQGSMLALLQAFQDGYRYDTALEKVYGFDADGLDRVWRESVGASRDSLDATAHEATPTVFPTIQPYVIESSSVQTSGETPPTEASTPEIGSENPAGDVSSLPWGIGLVILGVTALMGIVWWLQRRRNRLPGGGTRD